MLDLAGGFGRLAVVAARAGRDVLVVEADAGVLAHRDEYLNAVAPDVRRRIRWHRGDARGRLPRPAQPYALALLAFNALNEITEGLEEVIANACGHLAPGGSLFVDCVLEPRYQHAGVVRPHGPVEAGGERWFVSDLVVPTGEREHTLVLLYDRGDERLRQHIPRRVWPLEQIAAAAAGHGAELVASAPALAFRRPFQGPRQCEQ